MNSCQSCKSKFGTQKSLLRHNLWEHRLVLSINEDDYNGLLECAICVNKPCFDNTTEVIDHV